MKMSRKIACLLCLILCLTLGGVCAAAAESFAYTQQTDGTIRIIACSLNTATVTIPAEIDGKAVSGIAANSFAACTAVREIILPTDERLVEADQGAFPTGATVVLGDMRYTVKAPNALEIAEGSVLSSSSCSGMLGIPVTSIGPNAFSGADENWTGVLRLPEGFTFIGEKAFEGVLLQELRLPASMQELSADALTGAVDLQRVHAHAGVTVLGENAFGDHEGLTVYAATGSAAAEFAVQNQIDCLTFSLEDNVAVLTGAAPWMTEVNVPASALGCDVWYVGEAAFQNDTDLVSVHFDSIIHAVRENAFNGCTALQSVNTGALLNIYDYAFCNTALTELPLNQQLDRVGNHAFQGTQLTSVELPKWMTYLGEYVFADCTELIHITGLEQFDTIRAGSFRNTALTGYIYIGSIGDILEEAFAGISTEFTLVTSGVDGNLELTAFSDTYGVSFYAMEESHYVPFAEENGYPCVYFAITNAYDDYAQVTGFVCEPVHVDLTTYYGPITIVGIGDSAFKRCTTLKTILLPETLNHIGQDAFYGCKALTAISIPKGVTNIPNRAFYNCIKLDSVTLEGVSEIGSMAFYGCDVLPGIELPTTLYSIGDKAFYSCNILSDVTLNEGLYSLGSEAFGYCAQLTAVRLPASLESVGSTPFKDSGLTTVTMATTKKQLPSGIFSECYKLTRVTLPRNMTSIGSGAFSHCEALAKITLPINLETLGSSAFAYCTSLETIAIPDGVQTLESSTFYGCSSLQEVVFDGLPERLGSSAFAYCASLTAIEIPDSVNTLESSLFSRCESLQSIVIPDSVTTVGSSLFSGCTSLTDVTLPDTISILPDYMFSDCTALKAIELPDNLTEIGNCAFYNCTALKDVNFPVNLVEINSMAFQYCYALTKVELGQKVERISNDAFGGCDIRELTLSKGLGSLTGSAFSACTCLEKVVVPEGITSISDDYFGSFANGATLVLPASLQSGGAYKGSLVFCLVPKGSYADSYCMASNGVYSPYHAEVDDASATYRLHYSDLESEGTIVSILPAEGVTALTLPAELAGRTQLHIGPGACAAAGNVLTSVTLPTSILTIGSNAFSGQPLTSVVIPEGVTAIGIGAFGGCSGLTSVTLPSTLQTLSGFNGTGLASIAIPDGVTEIGAHAFNDCAYLTDVTLPASLKTIGEYAFYGLKITGIDLPDGLETIGRYAFSRTWLGDVVMPDSVISLGEGAYASCERMQSVRLSNGLTEIPAYAFDYCHCLKRAVMPSGLKKLGYNAFASCSLTDYELPETLETICSGALCGNSVSRVTIPASVTTMESNAVYYYAPLFVAEGTAGKAYAVSNGHSYDEVRLLEDGTAELLRFSGSIPTRFGTIPITSIAGDVVWSYVSGELQFPPTIEHIGEGAFSGLTDLKVTVADGTAAHDFALTMPGAELVIYRPLSETAAELVSDVTNGSSSYHVPETVAGLKVTALAEDFMRSDTALSSVYLSGNLKSIGANAFADCTALNYLDLNNDTRLTSIGAGAFEHAPIQSMQMTLPEDLTCFGEGAFAWLLGKGSYSGFNVGAGTPAEAAIRDAIAAGEGDYNRLYSYRIKADGTAEVMGLYGTVVQSTLTLFGESVRVTSVGDNAWRMFNGYIGEGGLDIEHGIVSIGDNAFTDLTGLSMYGLTLPESVTHLGEGAFARGDFCTVTLPDSLTVIPDNAFADCSGLYSVTLGENVTSIGKNVFRGAALSGTFFLPNITHIGEGAFSDVLTNELGMTNATFVVAAGSATETHFKAMDAISLVIYEMQADGTATLTGVRGAGNVADLGDALTVTAVADNLWAEKVTSIALPETVTRIGSNAFKDMATLTSAYLPAGLTSLGVNAFAGTGIRTVNIPEGVTVIPDGAFANCASLHTLTLPDSLTSIGANAFSGASISSVVYMTPNVTAIGEGAFAGADRATFCVIEGTAGEALANSLTGSGRMIVRMNGNGTASVVSAVLPAKATTDLFMVIPGSIAGAPVTEICDGLFQDELRISQLSLPSQLQVIGKDAFAGCLNLYAADLPATLTALGEGAFANTNVSQVVIPAGVTEIPAGVFANTPISELYFNGTAVQSIGDGAFSNGSSLYMIDLVLPEGLETIGSNVLAECRAYSIILPDSLRSIGDRSFTQVYNIMGVLDLGEGLESVGEECFSNISNLSSLTLPSSLTSIGANAFRDCYVQTVDIPEGWTKIPDNAFNCWTQLNTVIIPETVTEIGANAFLNCDSLSSLTMHDGITKIGAGAFSGCICLTDVTLPGALEDLGENAFSGCGVCALTTPASWTKIPDGAFSGWSSLNTVVVCDQVTEIGANAFRNCTSLTSLTLSDNLTVIGDGAFTCDYDPYYGGQKGQLTSVTFPTSLVSIGKDCFKACGLTNVVLPEGLRTLGAGSFSDLESITLSLPDSLEEIGEGCFSMSGVWGKLTMPRNLKRIGSGAFGSNGISELVLPEGLEYLGGFDLSTSLTSVTIPSTVTEIGNAFSSSALTEVVIPEGVTRIGNNAFAGCTSLTSLSLPSTLVSIGDMCFQSCGVSRLVLPESLQSIGRYAFDSCNLSSIVFPKNLRFIGSGAFNNTYAYGELYMQPGIEMEQGAFGGYVQNIAFYVLENSAEQEVLNRISWNCRVLFRLNDGGTLTVAEGTIPNAALVIPETFAGYTVTAIGDGAFSGQSFASIDLPDTITHIGTDFCRYANGMTELRLPAGLTHLGEGSFYELASLRELVLPDSLEVIEANCFFDVKELTSLTLPRNLRSLGNNCFYYFSSVQELVIPDSLEVISDNCFYESQALTSLTLPRNLRSLGRCCFCFAQVREVVIPEGTVSIGDMVFYQCQNLTDVTLPGTLRSIGGDSPFGTSGTAPTMHVVYGTPGHYFALGGFQVDVLPYTLTTLPSMVTILEDEVFMGDPALKHVKLPDGMTTIGAGAFRNCPNLLSVEIPASVTSIAPDAFDGCPNVILRVFSGSYAETYGIIEQQIPCHVFF